MDENIYWQLILVFLPLSLVAVGGGQSVVAGINAQVVEIHHWVSQRQFVDLFAISRAAPGPGSLLATLIGWRVGGLGGAVASSLAFFLPTSLLAGGNPDKKAAKKAVKEILAQYDKNGNGVIDGDEVDAVKKAYADAPTGPLKQFDTNADGKLDDTEIAAIHAGKKKKDK